MRMYSRGNPINIFVERIFTSLPFAGDWIFLSDHSRCPGWKSRLLKQKDEPPNPLSKGYWFWQQPGESGQNGNPFIYTS